MTVTSTAPEPTAPEPPKAESVQPVRVGRVGHGLLDPAQLWRSLPDALLKLNPRTLWRNPVMLIVEVGAAFTTAWRSPTHRCSPG